MQWYINKPHPPPRPEQGGVKKVRSVGCSNDKHVLESLQAIQLSKKLGHNPGGGRVRRIVD